MKQVCIALHDVAPSTWERCERLLRLLDELGRPPLTLLAVPNYHAQGLLVANHHLVGALRTRIERGDEIALHGYYHRDDSPPAHGPVDWIRRRVMTAGEGEFATLERDEARRRILRGWHELNGALGPIRGFIAPAWLAGSGTWNAVRDTPLQYSATRNALFELGGMRRVAAPTITASSRSAWRRLASRCWISALSAATASAPILRIALHPADAEHPEIMQSWRRLLQRLLQDRQPVTKARALGLA